MPPDWNVHRELLQSLYLAEDKPLKEVMMIMETKYDFRATCRLARHNTNFNSKDGFRKNLSHEEWQIVKDRLQEREIKGRKSRVYLNGILVPEEKIRKEVSRHMSLTRLNVPDPRPPTPIGLSFRTPSPVLNAIGLKLDNLPCFQFQEIFDAIRLVGLPDHQSHAFVASRADVSTNLLHGTSPSQIFWSDPLSPAIPSFELDGDIYINDIDDGLFDLPIEQMSLEPVTEMPAAIVSSLFSGLLTNSMTAATNMLQKDMIRNVLPLLQAKMLERHDGELMEDFGRLLGPCNKDTTLHIFKFALYFSSNNMLGDKQVDDFLAWIVSNGHRPMSILKSLFSYKLPTIEACVYAIFRRALQAGNVRVSQALLEADIDLGVISKSPGLPLEEAVKTQNIKLIRLLLKAGADFKGRPFEKAIEIENIELVRLLLDAGGDFNGRSFKEAVATGNIELVQLLLQAGADINKLVQNEEDDIEFKYLGNILKAAETAEMAQLLLDAGADINALVYGESEGEIKTWLQAAIEHDGDIELVRTLLKAGAKVNAPAYGKRGRTALRNAVENWGYEVIEELLDSGAQVDVYGPNMYYGCDNCNGDDCDGDGCGCKSCYCHANSTELQRAAHFGNCRLTELLLNAGADVNKPAFGENGKTALQAAADDNHCEVVRILLDAGANANAPSNARAKYPRSALLAAVENGNIGLVEDLLEAGAVVNTLAFGDYGSNALEAALAIRDKDGSDKNLAMVELLEEAGADINLSINNSHRGFELCKAVERADTKRVGFLLNMGVDVNTPSTFYGDMTVLRVAISNDDAELVELLLKEGADVNEQGMPDYQRYGPSPLHDAIEKGNIEIARRLIKAGANVNAPHDCDGGTALEIAIGNEDVTTVQLLLHVGAEVNIPVQYKYPRDRTPLQKAAGLKNKDSACTITQLLLSKRPLINVPAAYMNGRTAIQAAVEGAKTVNDCQVIRILLEAGEDINAPAGHRRGKTALQLAVAGDNLEIVQFLLGAGADINAPAGPIYGRTALQVAVETSEKTSSFDMIDFLLDQGADVNGPSGYEQGRTALQIATAAKNGNIELIQRLLKAGADINAPAGTSTGLTALQGAAIQGHTKIALMLLEGGANVNAAGAKRYGRTALEGASEHGRLDMVHILLNAGGDSHLPERVRYIRSSELAMKNNHFTIVKLLEAHRTLEADEPKPRDF